MVRTLTRINGIAHSFVEADPPPLPEKKGDQKGKEKAKPSTGGENKKKLVLMKTVGPPPLSKGQSTIDKSLKKPIEAEPIFAIKILEREVGSLNKHQKNIQISQSGRWEGKGSEFFGGQI